MSATGLPPKEGDLYKCVNIGGLTFELRFGYYAEFERGFGEPVVIYPDLKNRELYDAEGRRLVTAIQDPCPHYQVSREATQENCCCDCSHYLQPGDEIGVCTHPQNAEKREENI